MLAEAEAMLARGGSAFWLTKRRAKAGVRDRRALFLCAQYLWR